MNMVRIRRYALTPSWVLAFIACHLIGAVPVLLNNGLHVDASVHCLNLTKPELVIVDDAMANQLGPNAGKLKEKGVGPVWCWTSVRHLTPEARAGVTVSRVSRRSWSGADWQELKSLKPSPRALPEVKAGAFLAGLNPESDGVIYFTSGTTSMPKGVLVTQRGALHIIVTSQYSESPLPSNFAPC